MIKPCDSLIYLYFNCSKCGERGDEMRLDECKDGGKHRCMFCGHTDDIEPISRITVVYNKNKKPTKEPEGRWQKHKHHRVAEQLLLDSGYAVHEARLALQRALVHHDPATPIELFKLAVLEHEEIINGTSTN